LQRFQKSGEIAPFHADTRAWTLVPCQQARADLPPQEVFLLRRKSQSAHLRALQLPTLPFREHDALLGMVVGAEQ